MLINENTIQELERELSKELADYGAGYFIAEGTYQGDKKLAGKHITVTFPAKVKFSRDQIVNLFNKYYGKIISVGQLRKTTSGITGVTRQELDLFLEE